MISQYTESETKVRDLSLALLEGLDDWTAYLGVSPEKAIDVTTAAINGQYQALRSLGVPINDNIVANSRYVRSLSATWDQLDENQKAYARIQYILELYEKAVGAAEAAQGTFTWQLIQYEETVKDIKETVAREFLPVLTEGLKTFTEYLKENKDSIRDVAQAIVGFVEWLAKLAGWLSGIPGWVFPVTIALGLMLSVILKLTPSLLALSSTALPKTGTALASFGATASSAIPVILTLTAAAFALAAVFASLGYLIGRANSNKLDLGLDDVNRQISELTKSINNIPKYATGTNSARAGWALVGERGPELVRMAGGEQVLNAVTTSNLVRQMSAAPVGISPGHSSEVAGPSGNSSRTLHYVDRSTFHVHVNHIDELDDLLMEKRLQRIRMRAAGKLM